MRWATGDRQRLPYASRGRDDHMRTARRGGLSTTDGTFDIPREEAMKKPSRNGESRDRHSELRWARCSSPRERVTQLRHDLHVTKMTYGHRHVLRLPRASRRSTIQTEARNQFKRVQGARRDVGRHRLPVLHLGAQGRTPMFATTEWAQRSLPESPTPGDPRRRDQDRPRRWAQRPVCGRSSTRR